MLQQKKIIEKILFWYFQRSRQLWINNEECPSGLGLVPICFENILNQRKSVRSQLAI